MLLVIPIEDRVWTQIIANLGYAPHRKVAPLIAMLNDSLAKAQAHSIAAAVKAEEIARASAAAGAPPGTTDAGALGLHSEPAPG